MTFLVVLCSCVYTCEHLLKGGGQAAQGPVGLTVGFNLARQSPARDGGGRGWDAFWKLEEGIYASRTLWDILTQLHVISHPQVSL